MTESTDGRASRRFRASPRVVVGGAIAILALVFVFQNTGRIRIHLLFADIDNPAWVWLLVLFAAGFVVGSLYPWFHRRHKRGSDS